MRNHYIKTFSVILFATAIITSCNTENNNKGESIESEVLSEIDSSATQIYKFDNTLFSVPSPYEISILMKKLKIEYNASLMNPTSNSNNYTDNFKKALNLGVYGADLAYLNMNNQIPEAGKYFATVKITTDELQLSNSFDQNTIKRIENNMGNEDSLLHILSKAYRNTDKYLKDNNRQDIGVLILTGGWVESLYFLAQVAQETQNKEVIQRLGDQKYPLDNLIKILSPYYNTSNSYGELVDSLIDLAYIYDGIEVEYVYEEPVTDAKNKITTINSRSNLLMNPEHVNMITDRIFKIRNNVTE
jgi:hypothetical protein